MEAGRWPAVLRSREFQSFAGVKYVLYANALPPVLSLGGRTADDHRPHLAGHRIRNPFRHHGVLPVAGADDRRQTNRPAGHGDDPAQQPMDKSRVAWPDLPVYSPTD